MHSTKVEKCKRIYKVFFQAEVFSNQVSLPGGSDIDILLGIG